MFKVIDVFKIGENVSVTFEGKCEDIKNGSRLIDENGNMYNIISVAMANYDNPLDISKSTTVLIHPCGIEKGELLKIA
ncbi:MAG: hypothetical protein LUF26_04560 [Firmicutes bacterium]|nr:hypothetical protein [Bacillota bacterium]